MTELALDRNGLEILDRAACLQLLRSATIGRIGISSRALPTILPINYRMFGDQIVFRTSPGTKLDAATRDTVVAFEVDDFDPLYHSGWSVVVYGVAHEIVDPPAELVETTPRWAPGPDGHVVGLSTEHMSGRRLGDA